MANATIAQLMRRAECGYCNSVADLAVRKATVGGQITKVSGWITAAGRIFQSSKAEGTGTGIAIVTATMIETAAATTSRAKDN